MKSLAVNLEAGNYRILPDKVVEGFYATVQCALLNVATVEGSNHFLPTQGTQLFTQAVMGFIYDTRSAQHAANFASVDVLFFVREHSDNTIPNDTLQAVSMQLNLISPQLLSLQASFTNQAGDVYGATVTTNTSGTP